MVDGSVIKESSYEAHTGQRAPTKLAAFMERILVRARGEKPAQPRWKVGWFLGMVGADVEILEPDGKHRRYGTWRHSPDAETDANKEELKEAKKLIEEPNFKTAGCSTCEVGATKQNKGEHSAACRQTVNDSGVARSSWTVKIDNSGQ